MKISRRIKYTYGFILLITVWGIFGRIYMWEPMPLWEHVFFAVLSFVLIALIWELNRYIHLLLNKYYPFEKNIAVRIILQIFLAAVLMISVRIFSMSVFYDKVQFMLKEESLMMKFVYFFDFVLAIAIHLGYISSYFFYRWKESLQKAERLEKEKALVQLDNLKNQVNPHFLFNSLTSLNSLIYENQELASQFLQQMSKVYRYVLQHRDEELVSLATELAFIRNYIFLLETRFDNHLRVHIRIPPEDMNRCIVPVTLQILLENAIKHNIISAKYPLEVCIGIDGDYLEVRNNITPKQNIQNSNRVGLQNLKNLYNYLSKKPVLVTDENGIFTVKIPLIQAGELPDPHGEHRGHRR